MITRPPKFLLKTNTYRTRKAALAGLLVKMLVARLSLCLIVSVLPTSSILYAIFQAVNNFPVMHNFCKGSKCLVIKAKLTPAKGAFIQDTVVSSE